MLNEPLLEPSYSQDSSNNVGSSSSTNNNSDASTTVSSSLLGTDNGVGDYEADAAAGVKQSPKSTAVRHDGSSEKKLSAFVLAVIIFFNAAGKMVWFARLLMLH